MLLPPPPPPPPQGGGSICLPLNDLTLGVQVNILALRLNWLPFIWASPLSPYFFYNTTFALCPYDFLRTRFAPSPHDFNVQ